MAENVAYESSSSSVSVGVPAEPETCTRPNTNEKWYHFRTRIGNVYDALSPSRQIFCLFCLFDFLFTFLLWIIYAQGVSVSGLGDSLSDEVGHYDFSTSLFDVMILSLLRVTILLAAYAYYRCENAYPVGITTFVSTVFLIVKAFIFEFDESEGTGGRPVDYFLHVGSFIVCWAEAWYLQVKVLPRERRIALLRNSTPPSYGTIKPPSKYSVLSFHTPPEDSDEEEEVVRANLQYIENGRKITSKALNFLYAEKLWNVEKRKGDILIESTTDDNLGKVLKARTFIEASPQIVYPLIFGDVQNVLTWNHSLTQMEVIYKVNSSTDITYSAMAEGVAGLISARDFVNLRHYQRVGSMFLLTSTAVTTPLKPPTEAIVRGELGFSCYALCPTDDNPDRSEFAWIVTTSMRPPSSIPQSIIEYAMPGFLIETTESLKKASETLKGSQNAMDAGP